MVFCRYIMAFPLCHCATFNKCIGQLERAHLGRDRANLTMLVASAKPRQDAKPDIVTLPCALHSNSHTLSLPCAPCCQGKEQHHDCLQYKHVNPLTTLDAFLCSISGHCHHPRSARDTSCWMGHAGLNGYKDADMPMFETAPDEETASVNLHF